jgi:xanthine dehydrogenase accessory factor
MAENCRVVIRGAGDLASGVAHRLWYAGFDVIMLELPAPLVVRRTVSFAAAVFTGSAVVEGVRARICDGPAEAEHLLAQRIIPVLVDPDGTQSQALHPQVLVDAILAKKNTGTTMQDAPVVIALGPGFTAGVDVHAVIETKRGHDLGRAIYSGAAAANTGIPGEVGGFSTERLLRAPADGIFLTWRQIGQLVAAGETVATVDSQAVTANVGGTLRGLLFPGTAVKKGMKVGDIDPRGHEADCLTISDKARAVAGGVLEAIMHLNHKRKGGAGW